MCRVWNMRIVKDTSREQTLIEAYLEAKQAADLAKQRVEEIGDRLIAQMEQSQTKTYTTDDAKLTYVRVGRPIIDEKGLRKALTAKVFDKYTTKTLNKKAMEDAMETGEVDPVIVSKFVTTKYNKPFLKVSAPEEN